MTVRRRPRASTKRRGRFQGSRRPKQQGGTCLHGFAEDERRDVSDESLEDEEIRNHLVTELPDYMLPSLFVRLEKLPKTQNGKLDVPALLKIKLQAEDDVLHHHNEGIEDIESIVYKVWANVLGVNNFRQDESFFNLGGNSLALMKVRKELESKLNIKINIVELFQYTTLRQLSKYLSSYKVLQNNLSNSNIFYGCNPR